MEAIIQSVKLICSIEDKFSLSSEKVSAITNIFKNSYPETTLNQDLEYLMLGNKKERKFILVSTFEIKIEHKNVNDFQHTIDEIVESLESILKEFSADKDKIEYSIYTEILGELNDKEQDNFLKKMNKSTYEYDFSMFGAEDIQTLVFYTAIKLGEDSYIIGIQPYTRREKHFAFMNIILENIKDFDTNKNIFIKYRKIIDNSENFICFNFIK